LGSNDPASIVEFWVRLHDAVGNGVWHHDDLARYLQALKHTCRLLREPAPPVLGKGGFACYQRLTIRRVTGRW